MIPQEANDHLCLLVEGNDKKGIFRVGILRMTSGVLTKGGNQDKKKSVSASGKKTITWLVNPGAVPANFLLKLDSAVRTEILSKRSGVQRMKALFTNVTNRIIPRTAIEQVAQQKDPLKRAREMKSVLIDDGFKVLCATYEADRAQILAHGITKFKDDDWISIKQN